MRASRRPRLGRPAVAGTETAHRTFTTPGHSLPIFRELTATQRPAQRHVRDGEPPSMHARAPRSRTSWRQARTARAARPPQRRGPSPLGHAGENVGSDESSWQHEADCPQRFSAQVNSSSIVKTPQLWHFSSSSRHSSVEDYSTVWSGNRRVAAEPAASTQPLVCTARCASVAFLSTVSPTWRRTALANSTCLTSSMTSNVRASGRLIRTRSRTSIRRNTMRLSLSTSSPRELSTGWLINSVWTLGCLDG